MGTILRWLTGSFGSYILIAVAVAFVGLGAAWGVQTWRVHSLTADVATANLDKQTYQQNASRCLASLEAQNKAVEELQARCTATSTAANAAAAKELARLYALHKKVLADKRYGPAAMNEFFRELSP